MHAELGADRRATVKLGTLAPGEHGIEVTLNAADGSRLGRSPARGRGPKVQGVYALKLSGKRTEEIHQYCLLPSFVLWEHFLGFTDNN